MVMDGVERAEHQLLAARIVLVTIEPRLQKARHHQHVGKEVVQDQRRARALEPCRRGNGIRQHERRVTVTRRPRLELPDQRDERARREQQLGGAAPHQRRLSAIRFLIATTRGLPGPVCEAGSAPGQPDSTTTSCRSARRQAISAMIAAVVLVSGG